MLKPLKTEQQFLIDLSKMREAWQNAIVLDIEGNTADVRAAPGERNKDSLTLGVSYAFRYRERHGELVSGYMPLFHHDGNLPQEFLRILRNVLQSKNSIPIRPIFHNAKYDLVGLRNDLDIDLLKSEFYCTMLMAHQIDENLLSYSLDSVSTHYGGKPKNKTDAHAKIASAFGWEYIPVELMAEYSENDAVITYELFEKELPEFNRQGLGGELWNVEREWLRFIERMESQGISIDPGLCQSEIGIGEKRMDEITSVLGGNPASPKYLDILLHERLGLPVQKTSSKTGKPSFDKTAMAEYEVLLEEQNDPTSQLVLEYRGWSKTVASNYRAYLTLLSSDGYLRPNYKMHGTHTSRLSCEKPNLQQIPRVSSRRWNGRLKSAFIPRPGHTLWEADFSNLELRLAAIYSGESSLLGAFEAGIKPFDAMASRLGWLRQDCKTFTYTVLYGGGDRRVSTVFKVPLVRAKQMRDEFFSAYPALREFAKEAASRAKQRGYVKLWTGRRRHFYDPESESRKAMNSIFQGGGAELVKRTGIRLGHCVDWESCNILLQIHDSYVAEIRNGEEERWLPEIQRIMQDVGYHHEAFKAIPFPVGIKRWGEE